jgi:hypothetical protein
MAGRFESFMARRFSDGRLGEQLAPGTNPTTALMLAGRTFLQYFAVEILFGVPDQFGKDSHTTVKEISEILRHGLLKPRNPG